MKLIRSLTVIFLVCFCFSITALAGEDFFDQIIDYNKDGQYHYLGVKDFSKDTCGNLDNLNILVRFSLNFEEAWHDFNKCWDSLSEDTKRQLIKDSVERVKTRTDRHRRQLTDSVLNYPFEGIGIGLQIDGANDPYIRIKISQVFLKSPAAKEIRSEDYVYAIDGTVVDNYDVSGDDQTNASWKYVQKFFIDRIADATGPIKITLDRDGQKIDVIVEKAIVGAELAVAARKVLREWKDGIKPYQSYLNLILFDAYDSGMTAEELRQKFVTVEMLDRHISLDFSDAYINVNMRLKHEFQIRSDNK